MNANQTRSNIRWLPPVLIALLVVVTLTGCASTGGSSAGSPYRTPAIANRSPLTAERLTLQAADVIEADPDRAEELLRKALTADIYHGPAHNNLGVLHLQRGDLYEAAHEFEWARKLMPGHPDPRMNLALTLERAGRIDEALETYAAALEVYAEHTPTIQALTRCQLRYDRSDERTPELLRHVALHGDSDRWRSWSQRHLTRLP